MGQNNSSTSSIKKNITNEINELIKTYIKDFSNIVNNITNEVSTSMIQEVAANIRINTVTGSRLANKTIIAKGSEVDIEQKAKIQAENDAIIKINQSSDSMNELANKIDEKVRSSQAGGSILNQAGALGEAIKNAGGPEAFLDSIMNSVNKMVGALNVGGSSSDKTNNESTIRKKIMTDIMLNKEKEF
jgi:hypothetical protein